MGLSLPLFEKPCSYMRAWPSKISRLLMSVTTTSGLQIRDGHALRDGEAQSWGLESKMAYLLVGRWTSEVPHPSLEQDLKSA